ncbi:hypothetical protein PR048_004440 [Dryococelus australis]|uniref:Uncharacterized protein n=1 Tax=Dryococelus australis TaxID=614101 RepID=A0ABQ9I5G2_9NEOP|nr:hypothetical protein PR048_004440 [Dryococelus australis]
MTPTKYPAAGGTFPEETVDKPTILSEFSGSIDNTEAQLSSITCCKSYYDIDSVTAKSTYQSIGTRLNDDSSVNIMGDKTVSDEEECDNVHILQEDNILCKEESNDIPENNGAPRIRTPNTNNANDSDNHEAILENEETCCNGEVVRGPKKIGINPVKWNKSVKKIKMQRGEEYTKVTRYVKRAKYAREECDLHCKFQCKNINNKTHIFDEFYALDVNFKRNFVSKLMDEIHPTNSCKKEGSQRSPNVAHHFIVDGHRIREGIKTRRKLMKPLSKTLETISIRSLELTHITAEEVMTEFIDGGLDISQIYKLYVNECQTEPSKSVALKHKYESVFNTEFNITFFRPKKDLCSLCTSYENSSQEEEILLQQKYDDQQKGGKKNLLREAKENDIAASRKQPYNYIVACFDMQAIIPLPCGNVSTFYYKRKLNALNFTIYNATNETNISHQCVFMLSKILAFNVVHKKYLILGHTKNEGNATHSPIDRKKKQALKSGPLIVSSQIATIAQIAKTTGKPYKVQQVDTTSILDWKSFYSPKCKKINISAKNIKIYLEPR